MANLIPWRRKKSDAVESVREGINFFPDWFFEDSLFPLSGQSFTSQWHPRIDLTENDREVVVEADCPGMDKKDIQVSLSGRHLTLSGEKTQEKKETKKGRYLMERSYGAFNRSIELPANVEPSRVKATYKNGVLKVTLPKTKEHQGRTIKIEG